MAKKSKGKKRAKKSRLSRARNTASVVKRLTTRHEIVVRVAPNEITPTLADLAEPMQEGKNLAITPTWVSSKQIMRMVQRTPKQFVYSRPAKGGGRWNYVTGAYIEKVLNFVFGFMWDFEIVEHGKEEGMVWVKGKLTVKDPKGHTITKMQFGRADIKMKKTGGMLDYGNDLKAASTDSLKKCASLLGIASDIYGSTEYKEETGAEPRTDVPVIKLTPGASVEKAVEDTKAKYEQEKIDCHGWSKGGCPDGAEVDPTVRDYSMKIYGKPMCRNCQKEAKPIERK